MNSITRTNSILENFKLDGIASTNPVEEYKEKKKSDKKTKEIYRKCMFFALTTNILQFLLIGISEQEIPLIKSNLFSLPSNYSTLRIPIQLTTPITAEVNKIKLATKNKRSILSDGLILKSENKDVHSNQLQEDHQHLMTVNIPTQNLHEILKHIKSGISVVPYKLKISKKQTQRVNYEITL